MNEYTKHTDEWLRTDERFKDLRDKAAGATMFGAPLKDLSAESLAVCVVMAWEAERRLAFGPIFGVDDTELLNAVGRAMRGDISRHGDGGNGGS